jgi:hypothetical protein
MKMAQPGDGSFQERFGNLISTGTELYSLLGEIPGNRPDAVIRPSICRTIQDALDQCDPADQARRVALQELLADS